MKTSKIFIAALFLILQNISVVRAADGTRFTPNDIHWDEIEMKYHGICVCPAPPPVYVRYGSVFSYWEPFLYIDTVKTANFSPFMGKEQGSVSRTLSGKNQSSNSAEIANDSSFAQSHAFMFSMLSSPCKSRASGGWWTEKDSLWQSDELAAVLMPDASLYANPVMQKACMADAASTNLGHPIDAMHWCVGSGGSIYPLTGTVGDENYIQANNTVAARMLAKLNRVNMICDPAESLCGCVVTNTWIKSHYKTHVARPDQRAPARPFGVTSKFYEQKLNIPYHGAKGSNDEFLWIVYRKQLCCTCCD